MACAWVLDSGGDWPERRLLSCGLEGSQHLARVMGSSAAAGWERQAARIGAAETLVGVGGYVSSKRSGISSHAAALESD